MITNYKKSLKVFSGVAGFYFLYIRGCALANNLAAPIVARLAALSSFGLALRFRLAPSKPTVLNNFLHGKIPNLRSGFSASRINLATRPDPIFATAAEL